MTHTPSFGARKDALLTLLHSGSSNGREDIRKYLTAHVNQLAAAPELLAALAQAADALEMVIRNRPQNEAAPTNIALDVIAKGARAAIAHAETST